MNLRRVDYNLISNDFTLVLIQKNNSKFHSFIMGFLNRVSYLDNTAYLKIICLAKFLKRNLSFIIAIIKLSSLHI